jgi:glycosyltransferase involved in cell wall biosynthesis
VPALRRLCPQAHTYFVGDFLPEKDDYARTCAEFAAQAEVKDAVTFVGYTRAVADWYRACDLVIVPTRKEGLARCMIEALACSTPVVSFDVCSAREILEAYDCGVVVPGGDYAALAGAVHTIATDDTLFASLRVNAIATARSLFAPARMVEEYRQLYRSVHREAAC